MNNEDYIQKWIEGTLSEEEQKAFEQSDTYREVNRIIETARSYSAPVYDVDAELDRLHQRRSGTAKVIRMQWLNPVLRVAAAVILLVVAYFYFTEESQVIIETAAGEKTELTLPDGSVVLLNASSRITYQEEEWPDNRELELHGEAYFKVAKGSAFDVITSPGTITVLGTQFNVNYRNQLLEVACYEGRVAVMRKNESVELTPNHQYRLLEGESSVTEFSSDPSPAWTRNESTFKSIPYKYVIRELEVQYGVSVTADGIDTEQKFTGSFVHDDLERALDYITIPLELEYSISGDQITLTR